MSGYLQRIALGARTSARTIHPLVGSLHGAPAQERPSTAGFLEQEGFAASARPASNEAVPFADFHALVEPKVPYGPAGERGDPERPGERRATETSQERIKIVSVIPPSGSPAWEQPAERGATETQPLDREREDHEAYNPRLSDRGDAAEGRRMPAESRPPTADSGRKEAELSRRGPAPAREPDEIHIHIGRIEVTAAPKTEARPTAPAPRKSLNLDDYLKRGRGRGA